MIDIDKIENDVRNAPNTSWVIEISRPDALELIERVRQSEARIAEAAKLHRPVPTGREMYVTGNAGEIYGVEPTYICPSGCNHSISFFKGDECESWKALGLSEGSET